MFEVGFTEIILILGIALLVLGPEKLPRLAAQVGLLAPVPAQARRTQQWAEAAAAAMEPEKAKVPGTRRIRQDVVDAMKRDLADVIAGLMAETARKVEKNYDHIVTRPDDASAYWSDERAEKRLIAAMTPLKYSWRG